MHIVSSIIQISVSPSRDWLNLKGVSDVLLLDLMCSLLTSQFIHLFNLSTLLVDLDQGSATSGPIKLSLFCNIVSLWTSLPMIPGELRSVILMCFYFLGMVGFSFHGGIGSILYSHTSLSGLHLHFYECSTPAMMITAEITAVRVHLSPPAVQELEVAETCSSSAGRRHWIANILFFFSVHKKNEITLLQPLS